MAMWISATVCFAAGDGGMASGNVARLDLRPGFREFKFKSRAEGYIGMFNMHKTDVYAWPDIVQVYSCSYHATIGNTKIDSVHVFFLGNSLVRTLVFLHDTLNDAYLNRYFGTPMVKGTYAERKDGDRSRPRQGRQEVKVCPFQYVPEKRWEADMVRMEIMKANGLPVMDVYMKDFGDMMEILDK